FASDLFDCVAALDLLEHVSERAGLLSEMHRVVCPNGIVVCTTPNRFSLSPEPHVGLWGVGLLPRNRMRGYVRWRNGMSYEHVYPLSLWDARKLMVTSFRGDVTVQVPVLSNHDVRRFRPVKRFCARLYNKMMVSSSCRYFVLPIAPFFQLV